MSVIHVAAGMPPGHADPCTCRPLLFVTADGNELVIHRIAAPEMLRPPTPEAVNGVIHTGTRIHGNREVEAEASRVRPARRHRAYAHHSGRALIEHDAGDFANDPTGDTCALCVEGEARGCPLNAHSEGECQHRSDGSSAWLAPWASRQVIEFGHSECIRHGTPARRPASDRDAQADPGALPDPAPQHG